VTHLRKMMLDELQRRNYAQNTVRAYISAVEEFAAYFRKRPDLLGPEHIRGTKCICFATANCLPEPANSAARHCGFSL
jgi:hypothetical protein